uniref:SFRICE_021912 n=1 Tax=Spodoptera frugiperda TaxID=7108 RepID=A0A2H1VTR2_SPOFR
MKMEVKQRPAAQRYSKPCKGFPPKTGICNNFDLIEIVFICVAFTFLLIIVTQACRLLSSGFIHF